MLSFSLLRAVGCAFPLCAAVSAALAETTLVDSVAALQQGIAAARPGDTITVKNGRYTTDASLAVTGAGTEQAPITISAESVGGVTLLGSHGFDVTASAAHIIIQGFVFAHASGQNTIRAGATHVRFTRNTFWCPGNGPYLQVSGDDAEVDHNEFRDKSTVGNMISVTGVGGQVARRLHIHHNYFHDFTNAGANGAETIRFGLSGLSMSRGDGLVEYNLFVRCRGENELISNKSGGNTYRYNTFLDSAGAQLTLRHGNECVVYGNIFRRTDGLRIFGDRHHIFGNYFEQNSMGINLGNGGAEVADGAPLTSHDRPDDCVISSNILIENTTHYRMTRRTPTALGATNTKFADNIMVGGGKAAQIEGPNPGATWSGNTIWRTAGAGDLPTTGYTETDPKLTADADGIFRRPATAAAAGDDPASVAPRLLEVREVGPHAGSATTATGAPIAPPARVALFDGQSFAGWTFVSRDAAIDPASIWHVTDGVVRCEGKPNGYARAPGVWRDYALHFEWRWPSGPGNSGVFLHLGGPDRVWPLCLEVQLKADDAGSVRANGGSLVHELDLAAKDPKNVTRRVSGGEKPVGEWNTCDVVCRGDSVVVTINGVRQNEVSAASITGGAIALQAEGAPVEFRNLHLDPL